MAIGEFDHLVLILRDQLQEMAPLFEADGYCLTDLALHNIGSMNRLITLKTTYIELMGWTKDKAPVRKEIADSPTGLDALVFRSHDAQATHAYLKEAGFDLQPISRLERPIIINGKAQTARFDTVRFATQPIDGLRVYFCQHLTPEYVWVDHHFMQHPNEAGEIQKITVCSRRPDEVASILSSLAQCPVVVNADGSHSLMLANMEILVQDNGIQTDSRIESATIRHNNGFTSSFDTHI